MDNEEKKEPSFKITDKDDTKMEITKIRASDRTRHHLNSPGSIAPVFSSNEDLVKHAEEKYASKNAEEVEEDKKKGFDINNPKSVMDFPIPYTPVGNSIIYKQIVEAEQIGSILIPTGMLGAESMKAIVMVAGLYVNNLKRGDIITFKPIRESEHSKALPKLPPSADRIFNGVKFKEASMETVAGVYQSREIVMQRIADENKFLGYKQD